MADTPLEHKEGGDEGKASTVVPVGDEPSVLQCVTPVVFGENTRRKGEAALHQSIGALHSSEQQQNECANVTLHPLQAGSAKSTEKVGLGSLVVKGESEKAESSKKQDELIQGSNESKLAKATVSQAKDPPDKEDFQAKEEVLVAGKCEPSATEGASGESLPVSTNPYETTLALTDSTSGQPASGPPAFPEAVLNSGDVSEKSCISTESGGIPAVEHQGSLIGSSELNSLSTEKPPSVALDMLSSVSSVPHQEVLADSQGSSQNSLSLPSFDIVGAEGSSTQSSSMSSESDLFPRRGVEHSVVVSLPQPSSLAFASTSLSTPSETLRGNALQQSGGTMALLVNQVQGKETEQLPTSKGPCLQGFFSAENKSQANVIGEKSCGIVKSEKIGVESKMPDTSENLSGQGEVPIEVNENWNGMNFTCETDTETLPLIVATHSLSQEQNTEKKSTEKVESVTLEADVLGRKTDPSLESEPLKPVTIGSSLQPLEEVQEASAAEDASFAAEMAIIDSSADEADSIGGLVINNVIGAADGVVDFHQDEVETEKELTDISASAPQLVEGGDSSDEHGPSAKRRRLENGTNGSEDKLGSAKRVILKVIPVKNGHGVWDSQKLQEVLLTKGTVLLQIHVSKESMELFEPDKSDKKIDFTAIMANAKDDDHDHILSYGNVDPECDDPLAISSSASETTSPSSYGRPFSHPCGRSTALQPAMSRPGFKHLQTPQQYLMKNEVLGLPQPLEFEEPQMGPADWSGFGHKSMSAKQQNYQRGHKAKATKVCKVCNGTYSYPEEVGRHRHCGLFSCEKCPFATKNLLSFNNHSKFHQAKYVAQKCTVCFEVFSSPITYAVHKRKIHGLYDCKYCSAELPSKAEWSSHMKFNHKDQGKNSTSSFVIEELNTSKNVLNCAENVRPFQCHVCSKELECKEHLDAHIIQHRGAPDKKSSAKFKQLPRESYNKKFLVQDVPMIVPFSSSGTIINSSVSRNTISTSYVQSFPSVHNPQLSSLGERTESNTSENLQRKQTNFTSLISIDEEGITCKEEPLEVEDVRPETFLVKLKPKRIRRNRLSPRIRALSCESCPAVFKNLTALRIHVKQKHTVKPKCPACNISKLSARKVYQHQATVHKNKLRCHHYCLALFDTREELSAHHIKVHNKDDTLMKCRYCRTNYVKGTYLKHLEECTGERTSKLVKKCTSCNKKFANSTKYSDHLQHCESANAENDGETESHVTSTLLEKNPTEQESEKPSHTKLQETLPQNAESTEKSSETQGITITEGKTNQDIISNEGKTNQDINSSKGKINFKCRFCPKIFNAEEKGIDHMLKQHKTAYSYMKEYKVCDICGKLFISGLSLCKHLLKHYEKSGLWNQVIPSNFSKDDIKGKCWICKTSGISYSEYHIHNRDAIIDRIFSSQACKRSVSDEGDSFNCCLCEETFCDKHKFWIHIKVHLSPNAVFGNVKGVQHFSCPRCTQKYKTRSELLEHVAFHLIQQNTHGDKSGKLRSSNTFADTNEEMHRDFKEEELQGESDDSKLKTDISVDTMNSFNCMQCQQAFSIKSDALKHLQSEHKKELKEMITGKACHLCPKSFIKPLSLCSHILNHYVALGMWEDLVPRDLLSQINNKSFCWICKTTLEKKSIKHINQRNDCIERSLSIRSEEPEEDRQFQCPVCEFSCSNRYAHWKHIKLHLYLNRKSLSKTDFLEPEANHSTSTQDSENRKFDCRKCNKHFYDMSELRKHSATHFLRPCKVKKRKLGEIVSESKRTVKKRKTMTLRSKSLRSSRSNLKCIRCSKTFSISAEAVSHVLSTHTSVTQGKYQDLTCSMCGVRFKSEWWLCRHVLKHYASLDMWDALVPRDLVSTFNSKNQCWICKCVMDKNYAAHTSKRNAYIGMLLTTSSEEEETIFDCSLCNQEFPTRVEYWKHMNVHMSKPPSEYSLESDRVPKDMKKTYECSDCSMCFQNIEEFHKHLAFHYLECLDEQKIETGITVEEQLSEDAAQPEDSSSSEDDEWLPPRIVKKKES